VIVNGWTVVEWPHSRALGERWLIFPPQTPPDKPWPGLKFFATCGEAVEHAAVICRGVGFQPTTSGLFPAHLGYQVLAAASLTLAD
jgi:hypothetical protein